MKKERKVINPTTAGKTMIGSIGPRMLELTLPYVDQWNAWFVQFDNDPAKVGTTWGSTVIRHTDELEQVVEEAGVDLVILAIPAHAAQDIADRAVRAGVKGLLNFAPVQIRLPKTIPVEDVNLVMELEALSFQITRDA